MVLKMNRIKSIFLKSLCILSFVFFARGNRVGPAPHDFPNLEQINSDLFFASRMNESGQGNVKCLMELNAIRSGLENFEQWALKLLDSWGKIPSGVMSGNLYALGAFSQCFNITRDAKVYRTQYCLGKLVVDGYETKIARLYRTLLVQNVPTVTSLSKYIGPDTGAITFGLCVPAVCPLDFLEPLFNDVIHQKVKNISVTFSNDTCQLEESASQFKKIDIFTIGLLVLVLCLILASTCYDLVCTIYNRNKSSLLLAFSIYTNGIKLLSIKQSKSTDVLHCLHGLRVISTQWIVMGHTYLFGILLPIQNLTFIPTFMSEFHSTFILSAVIAVDTFFVMSGLLVSINLLKHLQKYGTMNIARLYLHRYIRLTALLTVSFLFSMSLLRFFGSGPLWPDTLDIFMKPCERYWWSTLLYVQNYVNPNEMCFPHSWYLSVELQLFLCAPPIVYLIYRFKAKALPFLVALVLGCIGCTVATYLVHNITQINMIGDDMALVYLPTHIRYSPWLIGVIAGYFFVEAQRNPFNIPKMVNHFAWAISLAVMAMVLLVNYPLTQLDAKYTPIEYALYASLSRIGWAIALCYIIFACVHGYGGPVNWFLSHPLWQPLSRLSYAIYLVHFPVIILTMGTMKTTPYISEFSIIQVFIANYVISVFVAKVATLAFESPIIAIEKLIFSSNNKTEINNRSEQNERCTNTDDVPYVQIENNES